MASVSGAPVRMPGARVPATRMPGARVLAGLLATSGTAHLVTPWVFDAIVPRLLPGPARGWTTASGIAELAVAGAVLAPATRRAGAGVAALLFVAVFPANVQMALDAFGPDGSRGRRAVGVARLPMQVPLVMWALRIRRAAA